MHSLSKENILPIGKPRRSCGIGDQDDAVKSFNPSSKAHIHGVYVNAVANKARKNFGIQSSPNHTRVAVMERTHCVEKKMSDQERRLSRKLEVTPYRSRQNAQRRQLLHLSRSSRRTSSAPRGSGAKVQSFIKPWKSARRVRTSVREGMRKCASVWAPLRVVAKKAFYVNA